MYENAVEIAEPLDKTCPFAGTELTPSKWLGPRWSFCRWIGFWLPTPHKVSFIRPVRIGQEPFGVQYLTITEFNHYR
jgi:hypothetical protein